MCHKQIILNYMPSRLKDMFGKISENVFQRVREIRVRVGKPIILTIDSAEFFLSKEGLVKGGEKGIVLAQKDDISQIMELMSGYSPYAFEEQMKQGYITLSGGHRVGICGQPVVVNGEIKTMKNLSGLNIRISHEVKGCGENVMSFLGESPRHTLIISPPCAGKTTLLRDLVRIMSNRGYSCGVADERSEIAGTYMGVPQNDVGIRTDVLDACRKDIGMMLLLRSMSPRIIAADEIGHSGDISAISEIIGAGIKIYCTVHGESYLDAKNKLYLSELIDKRTFERYVVLSARNGAGTVESVHGKNGEVLYNYLSLEGR
ncbi:stage III sporulation protein AA [Clostridia bacterium]|nr:stage III sporulation protein AA [Clostridia bacterium]